MIDFFENLPPYLQALVAGIITWLLTALGPLLYLYLNP